jgi:hypothetical protein
VEQVAFPQHGLLINPGTAELLEEALVRGVEAIGGIDPAGMDGDPVRHLDIVFELAARHGAGVDLHLHDAGSLGVWELELIADRTRDAGLGGRVTVSHAYGFCQADPAVRVRSGSSPTGWRWVRRPIWSWSRRARRPRRSSATRSASWCSSAAGSSPVTGASQVRRSRPVPTALRPAARRGRADGSTPPGGPPSPRTSR